MKDNQFMLVLFKEKEEVNMKIVLLNGSPRRGGNTEIMINTFMENVKDHDVVKLNIASMNIKGCLGCKYCWSHQGECVQKDDMEQVWTHLKEADVLIFGSPIYWFDMTAQLKTVIDRMYAGGSTGFHFHKTALLLDAVRLMKKLYGIDMEKTQHPKLINEIPQADMLISMGCNVGCPFVGKEFDDNWQLDDPTGKENQDL